MALTGASSSLAAGCCGAASAPAGEREGGSASSSGPSRQAAEERLGRWLLRAESMFERMDQAMREMAEMQRDAKEQMLGLMEGQSVILKKLDKPSSGYKTVSFGADRSAHLVVENKGCKDDVDLHPSQSEFDVTKSQPIQSDEAIVEDIMRSTTCASMGMDSVSQEQMFRRSSVVEDVKTDPAVAFLKIELHVCWLHAKPVPPATVATLFDVFKTSVHRDKVCRSNSELGYDGKESWSLADSVTLRVRHHSNRNRWAKHLQRFVMAPSSRGYVSWSLLEGSLLAYEVLAVPVSVMDPPETLFSDAVRYTALVFWSADIPLSLFKGYITQLGDVETRFGKTALEYVRSSLVLDVVLLAIEYMNFVLWRLEAGEELPRASRFVRVMRFSRMLKVWKMRRLLRTALAQVSSPSTLNVIYNSGQLVLIFVMCHVSACIWYVLGERAERFSIGDEDPREFRWGGAVEGAEFAYRYTTCLQWSLSQLGYGGIDVYATNVGERIYASVFTAVCMVSLIKWTAHLITGNIKLQRLQEAGLAKDERLAEYMKDRRVSWNLRNRIWKHLKRKQQAEHGLHTYEHEVHHLRDLPRTVAVELRSEVFIPPLTAHPFFGVYGASKADKYPMYRLLDSTALQGFPKDKDDVLFSPGDKADHMYFCLHGCLNYLWKGTAVEVSPKDWLAEAALWLNWDYVGQTISNGKSDLVSLEAAQFQEFTMSTLPEAQRYAKVFYNFAYHNKQNMNDRFPEPEHVGEMAQGIFQPETTFSLSACRPVENGTCDAWKPTPLDWKATWASCWSPPCLLSSSAMVLAMSADMKHDAILMFQTLFAQSLRQQKFQWSSNEEIYDFDQKVLFLKRLVLCIAVCRLSFTDENNGTALRPWPFPLASSLCHGCRVLFHLSDVSYQELLNLLLSGDGPSVSWDGQGVPTPFYARKAASHRVVMKRSTLQLREVKVEGISALGRGHLGMDIPVGGLGNPTPLLQEEGLYVGPAGVPYRADAHGPVYNTQHQNGHLYVRCEDFGSSDVCRVGPKPGGGGPFGDMTQEELASLMERSGTLCFDGLSLAPAQGWSPVPNIYSVGSLVDTLRRLGLPDSASDADRMQQLFHLMSKSHELVLESTADGRLRCRGVLLHIAIEAHLDGCDKLLVHSTTEAVENSRAGDPSQKLTPGDLIRDERVVTVLLRHDQLWSSSLGWFCREVLKLSEASVEHLLLRCSETAALYKCGPSPSACFNHLYACEGGIPLEYETLHLTVRIDNDGPDVRRHHFEPILRRRLRRAQKVNDLSGFRACKGVGSITHEWKWLKRSDAALTGASHLQPEAKSIKLDLSHSRLRASSLLIGIESSAPFKDDFFGGAHLLDAKSKALSAFGKRKWRDYRMPNQATPADYGGMHVTVTRTRLETLRALCDSVTLSRPSQPFAAGETFNAETNLFQSLLQSSDEECVSILREYVQAEDAPVDKDIKTIQV